MSSSLQKPASPHPLLQTRKEILRTRPTQDYRYLLKHQCSGSLSAAGGVSTVGSPSGSPAHSASSYAPPPLHRVNWLRYNVLVGIYENWLRIAPLILHILRLQPQFYPPSSGPFFQPRPLKRTHPPSLLEQEMEKQKELISFFQNLKKRRQELLSKLQGECENTPIQGETMLSASLLAHQLLSSLPLQNSKWSKTRIQKHNRLIEDMINNFSEDEFQRNSEVIMHSIRERLRFIHEMQQNYMKIGIKQRTLLNQKIELLKKPFKNMLEHISQQTEETVLEQLWSQIQQQREILLSHQPQLRHLKKKPKDARFTVEKHPESGKLTVKYQLKKSDYFNENYIRSKHHKPKPKNRKESAINEETIEENETAEMETRVQSVESIEEEQPEQDEAVTQAYIEAFMRRQKSKPLVTRQQKKTSFFRQKTTKFESSHHPSIYQETTKNSRDPIPRSSINSMISQNSDQRDSPGRRDSARGKISFEEIEEEREDHYSRFKSHKKIGTVKHIGSGTRRARVTKQGNKKNEVARQSNARLSGKQGRPQRKDNRREAAEVRRGNIFKRGGQRKVIEGEPAGQQEPPVDTGDYLRQRQEYIAYFTKIQQKGLLDSEQHQALKIKTQALLKKYAPSSQIQTHEYAMKMVEKSNQIELKIPQAYENFPLFLSDLRDVVSKDERIRMKIKQEMKIYFDHSLNCCNSDSCLSNEQYMFKSTELRHLNQQLKRVLWFRHQNKRLNFARTIIQTSDSLMQCSIG